MCGIFGYVGSRNALQLGLDALKRLDYRGYDSAGAAIHTGSDVVTRKAVGKVENLREKFRANPPWGRMGIFHTRWATHGRPSEANAHPHGDCGGNIWVVHNGMIENHLQIKMRLIEEGHAFSSETDTEVLAHLIEYHYCGDLTEAVREALGSVRGTCGLVVLSREHPQTLVAARVASPLVLGVGKGEYFIASDEAAIIRHTREIVHMDDREIAVINPDGYAFSDFHAERIHKRVDVAEWTPEEAELGGHAFFMHKEIHEQPDALERSLLGRIVADRGQARLGGLASVANQLRSIEQFFLIGCGTAYHAALFGSYLLEEYAGIRAYAERAHEFCHRSPVLGTHDAVLAVSQSGETGDTIEALQEARERGVLTLGIVNRVASMMTQETSAGVYNHIGPEIGVASTKAFVSQLAILALFSVFLGRQRRMSLVRGQEMLEALRQVPDLVRKTLEAESEVQRVAEKFVNAASFAFIGRKYNYPIALEGALKLQEIAYIPAQGYPAAEMKHGPIALVPDCVTIAIAPRDSEYTRVRATMSQIVSHGGPMIAVATDGDLEVGAHADEVLYVPPSPEWLAPILTVIPLQLLSYHMAILRGHDVDHPRNLAKSVTVG
jgi:glucosamine--fructose-6-phosphate aminotransferase (isomerizing)